MRGGEGREREREVRAEDTTATEMERRLSRYTTRLHSLPREANEKMEKKAAPQVAQNMPETLSRK